MYRKFIKRLLDIVLSACGIILLGLPMVVIAIAVKLDSKGPAIFWQKRIGIHKTTYQMPKFRSMYAYAPSEVPTHLMTDAGKWITPVGAFLRKYSLDELPQLFSVLVGHMSLVGPRPALWNQEDLIEQRDAVGANDVRPGLTGWAQINGRDEISLELKAQLDGEYVERLSFLFDVKCFLKTVQKVITADGVAEVNAEK